MLRHKFEEMFAFIEKAGKFPAFSIMVVYDLGTPLPFFMLYLHSKL
jgi:hypothetical protein